MTLRTTELLNDVDQAHDWQLGQVYGGGGTRYSSTDTCRVCGLQRKFFSDSQNGVSASYTFVDAHGNALTLREASQVEC